MVLCFLFKRRAQSKRKMFFSVSCLIFRKIKQWSTPTFQFALNVSHPGLFSSFQTSITIFITNICEKMTTQHAVLGFKPTTFRTFPIYNKESLIPIHSDKGRARSYLNELKRDIERFSASTTIHCWAWYTQGHFELKLFWRESSTKRKVDNTLFKSLAFPSTNQCKMPAVWPHWPIFKSSLQQIHLQK